MSSEASASQSVDLGFIPLVESYEKTLKNGIYSFPAWHSAFRGGCGEQAGKLACCVLGQGTLRDAATFMWKTGGPDISQIATPKRVQTSVQNIAIQFVFSWMEDKYGKYIFKIVFFVLLYDKN